MDDSIRVMVELGKKKRVVGTLTIRTTGTAGDPDYVANIAAATLMAALSTFTPPS